MKNILFISLAVLMFIGCSKEDGKVYTVTNLTGSDWYKTQVWYAQGEDVGSELDGYSDVGTVNIGEDAKFNTDSPFFYISAKSASGKPIMSKKMKLEGRTGITISKSDLY